MKQYSLIVIAIFVLTSSCTLAIQPPTPPAFVADISSTMTQASINQTVPITFSPTVTTTPEVFLPTDKEVIFRDNFVESLEDGWEWVNEDPSTWSLATLQDTLQIQSEFGYIHLGSAKNLLLRSVPQEDFIAETSLNFFASESDQFAGIVLMESEENFLQSGLGYCAEALGCIRNGFYIDSYQNGDLLLPRVFSIFDENIIFIRMAVQDNVLQIFASTDGLVWYRNFQKPLTFKPLKVGLFTGQNTDTNLISATFEYFEISSFK